MDVDQVYKRVQWMEDEHRKDKDAIALLESRITAYEGGMKGVNDQIKNLSAEITRLTAVVTRMDQYDANMLQLRMEAKRQVDDLDKDIKKREEEADKVRRIEVKALDTGLQELRKDLDILPRLEKGVQARVEEDTRLVRSVDDVRARLESVRRDEDEYTRTYRLLEDGRRQDAKRLTDLQGDVAVLRKQADSQRGQTEVLSTGLRKLETRVNELVTVEVERREAMQAFLDKQALAQVERDRIWKDWQTRFETIEKQATDTEKQLVALEATHREAKRTQQVLEDLNQRVERRINEITEVQRLGEDRFRQEWVTFKADDQKRWTSYTLTQEEQRSESHRQFDNMADRVTQLGDSLQEARDLLQQANELTEKRLQTLLASVHDWVTSFERTIGRTRSTG
jgi:chromosome segregation ATPase